MGGVERHNARKKELHKEPQRKKERKQKRKKGISFRNRPIKIKNSNFTFVHCPSKNLQGGPESAQCFQGGFRDNQLLQ